MRYLFTALAFIGSVFMAQAQSKEETVEWLNTNGSSLFNGTYDLGGDYQKTQRFVEVKNDTIQFYEFHHCGKCANRTDTQFYYFISVKSILFQPVNTLTRVEKEYGAYYILKVAAGGIKYTNNTDGKWFYNDTNFYVSSGRDSEENVKRVLNAIMYLAKVSGAKENRLTF